MFNDSSRKGILLAGGTGSRLAPLTNAICKQLLPVYDKPMIYYPLSTLMLTGIREILIIANEFDMPMFKKLLANGNQWGINIKYAVQSKPRGIADSLLIAEDFIKDSLITLALGDNIFYGSQFISSLRIANNQKDGATVFGYRVRDPEKYGVINFNEKNEILDIQEKPSCPKSNYVITGFYFYDNSAISKAKKLSPSKRGELEITEINNMYLDENKLDLQKLGRGIAWLDTGTFEALYEAGSYIKTIENRQGMKIGSPEEIAWRNGWITKNDLDKLSESLLKSGYGNYLKKINLN